VERLEADPLLEADYYQGDLLNAVLAVEAKFWTENPDMWARIANIAVLSLVDLMDESWRETIAPTLLKNYNLFLKRKPE
jgi:hypothetical protein